MKKLFMQAPPAKTETNKNRCHNKNDNDFSHPPFEKLAIRDEPTSESLLLRWFILLVCLISTILKAVEQNGRCLGNWERNLVVHWSALWQWDRMEKHTLLETITRRSLATNSQNSNLGTSIGSRTDCSAATANILKIQCPTLTLKSRGNIIMQTFWVNEEAGSKEFRNSFDHCH